MAARISKDRVGHTLGRFRIDRRIGAGGMGVVYEATDEWHGSRVAVKTLENLEPEAIYRLKSEFRSLAGVLHPHLVHMHELARDGEDWFFVMDYIEGLPLLGYLRPEVDNDRSAEITSIEVIGSEGPTTIQHQLDRGAAHRRPSAMDSGFFDRVKGLLSGLLKGLRELHSLGLLHCDIKPSNVLVTDQGRVVILDFGLTRSELEGSTGAPRGPRGTPLYMAPELFLGEPPTRASDYYAVGVILFEALVGRAPFGDQSHLLVAEKLYRPPVAPSDLVEGIPRNLSDACVALLSVSPQERPSAEQLAERLGLNLGEDEQAFPPSGCYPSARPLPFVGRREELSLLSAALEQVRSGLSGVITISGESGLGKTALIRSFLAPLQAAGDVLVLSGRCYEQESVPYKAFDQIADSLSSHLAALPPDEIATLVPDEAVVLTTLFPVLARVPAFRFGRDEAVPADPTEMRLRGLAGFRELLRRLAERRPVVLTIDDLQWADHDSALVFRELFACPTPPPLLTLLTSRQSEPDALKPLYAALGRNASSAIYVDELSLSPLTQPEAVELARHIGALHEQGLDVPQFIAEESQGNPFFVVALSRRPLPQLGLATSLPSFMDGWLGVLSAPALEILRLVAIAGRPLSESVLRALSRAPHLTELLTELAREHFIDAWPTPNRVVECYHDRIREAALSGLVSAQRRRMHAELGEVLEALGGADAETLANHFLAAGQAAKGARYAERAADEAALSLAFFHSCYWYERALSHTSDAECQRALRVKLGEAYASAGQGVRAARHLLEAADASPSQNALKLRQRAAELLLVCGHIDEGVRALESVLAHIRMNLTKTPRRSLFSLAIRRAQVKFRGIEFTSRSEQEVDAETLLKIDACWSVAVGLSLVDPLRAADFQSRNLLLSLDAGDPYRVARALAMEAGFIAAGGSRTEQRARQISAQAISLATQVGNEHALGLALFTAGLGRYLVSDWLEAIRYFDRAEPMLARIPGAIWELNATQRFRLNCQTYTGDLLAIQHKAPLLLRSAKEHGNLYSECALRVRGDTQILLVNDDPDAAEAETAEVMRRWSQEGFHLQHYNALWATCLCHIYRREGRRALHAIRETWPKLKASLLTRTQAVRVESRFLRTRVCLAALAEDPNNSRVRALLQSDIRSLRREHVGWATGFAWFAQGLELAGTAPERSLEALTRAERQFEAQSMELLRQACRFRRGQILGGDEGSQLLLEAFAFSRWQRVRDPERFLAHWGPAPGIDPSD